MLTARHVPHPPVPSPTPHSPHRDLAMCYVPRTTLAMLRLFRAKFLEQSAKGQQTPDISTATLSRGLSRGEAAKLFYQVPETARVVIAGTMYGWLKFINFVLLAVCVCVFDPMHCCTQQLCRSCFRSRRSACARVPGSSRSSRTWPTVTSCCAKAGACEGTALAAVESMCERA